MAINVTVSTVGLLGPVGLTGPSGGLNVVTTEVGANGLTGIAPNFNDLDIYRIRNISNNVFYVAEPTGVYQTYSDNKKIIIQFYTNAITGADIHWNTGYYLNGGAYLPTTITGSRMTMAGFIYSTVVNGWLCIASTTQI